MFPVAVSWPSFCCLKKTQHKGLPVKNVADCKVLHSGICPFDAIRWVFKYTIWEFLYTIHVHVHVHTLQSLRPLLWKNCPSGFDQFLIVGLYTPGLHIFLKFYMLKESFRLIICLCFSCSFLVLQYQDP